MPQSNRKMAGVCMKRQGVCPLNLQYVVAGETRLERTSLVARAYSEVTTGKQVFAHQMIFADSVCACFLPLAKTSLLGVQLTSFTSHTQEIKNTRADIYHKLVVIVLLSYLLSGSSCFFFFNELYNT